MSVQVVTVRNPDGTTTEVTMVCMQDRDGNVVRGADGAVDQSRCNFRPTAEPQRLFGPVGTTGAVALLLIFLVVAFLFF